MTITREELIDGINALPLEQRVELLNKLRALLKSLADEVYIGVDSIVYSMTRVIPYDEAAKKLGMTPGMINASVTRTKSRNRLTLNEEPPEDPSICKRCGLILGDGEPTVVYGNRFFHKLCADRKGHKMTMRVTSTWNSVVAFCECDWSPRTVFRSWMMARRAHYTYVVTRANLVKKPEGTK